MKIAIGTAQFGLDYGISNKDGAVSLNEIEKIFLTAKSHNIGLLDTAQAYGNSEEKIGSVNSAGFEIITKLKPGLTPSEIEQNIISSLDKINRKKIYGILFHNFNDYIDYPDSIDLLHEKKHEGVIRKIGFSLYYPSELDRLFNNDVKFDILQIPFNVFDQRFKPYFKELKKRNIQIHIRSIFLQGLVFLSPKKMSSYFKDYIQHFIDFHSTIDHFKMSPVDVCLNFVNIQPEVDKIILGVCSEQELMTNINALSRYSAEDQEKYNSLEAFQITDEKIILPFNWK